MRWNCMSKALRFLQITAEHQDCPFFTVFLTIKTLSQNISITLLQISLKRHEHRGCYWRKKLPWMIFEEQFPVPRYTAASKIGNSVISLLWQLRCRCNPDHIKFSSSSSTTLMAIFPKLCLWRRSFWLKLGRYWPWKTVSSHLMAIYGYTWVYMVLHGYTWHYMGIHGNTRLYMVIHGCRWLYMALHVYTWLFLYISWYTLITLLKVPTTPWPKPLFSLKTAGRQPGWGRYYLRSSRKNAQKPRGGWGETVFTR